MSLIEEALRKQREEAEKDSPKQKAQHSLTLTPPPLPPVEETVSPVEPVAPGRPLILVIGLFAGGAVLVILIIILLFYGWALLHKQPNQPGEGPRVVATNTPSASPTSPSTNPAPITPPLTISAPTQTIAVAPNAPALPPPSPNPTTITTPAAIAPPPAATPQKPLPVIWPRLSVSGIIGGGKRGFSAVIINGKTLSPGDSIEGVRVKTIENQKVKLVCDGEERSLATGSTTE